MNTLKQAVGPSGVVLALLAAFTLFWKNDTISNAVTNTVFVLVITVITMVIARLSSGKFNRTPAFMLAVQSIGYAIVANMATNGRYWLSVVWILIGATIAVWVFIQTKNAPRTKLKIARSFAIVAVGVVLLSGGAATILVNNSGPTVVETSSLPLYNDGNPLVITEVDLASIDQPLVGNGVNVATPPVLQDNKGLVTSWANFVERVNALPEAGKQNTIANTNGWNNVTKARYPDRVDLQFPSWNEIQHLATIPGEFRVIAKVNNDKSDQEAREAVRPLIGGLADSLPVVKVDGALINTMCGSGDCTNSFSPAQQFVDANGQFRIVLSKPVEGKNGPVVNVEAVKLGIGLGTECGNGFIGTTVLSPKAVEIVYGGTGNGDYTPPTPHTTTEVTPPPPPSTTTPPPPSTTTTVPPTTTTTVPPTTTTTVPPTTTTTVPPTTTTTVPPTTTTTVPPTTTTLTPKDEEEDPENQGNNQPGHGGQNDAPDLTPSDPAGGTAPATYTSEPAPMPTTEVRPDPIPTSNQGAPTDAPAPTAPAPGAEPCNPAICNEDGVDHAADAAAQAAAAAAEVASAPIAPVAPAATEAVAPAPAPAVVDVPAVVVADPTVDSQPTADTAGADVGDASDPVSDVSVAEVGLTSSATAEIPSIALWAIGGIIAIMFAGAFAANRNKPEEETKTVITMV